MYVNIYNVSLLCSLSYTKNTLWLIFRRRAASDSHCQRVIKWETE